MNAIEHLMIAQSLFIKEAKKCEHDKELSKACLEDAATINQAIEEIQNGENRGKYTDEFLAKIQKEYQ